MLCLHYGGPTSDNIQKKIRLIISVSLSALVALTFLFITFNAKSELTGRTYLDDGWNIIYNDATEIAFVQRESHLIVTTRFWQAAITEWAKAHYPNHKFMVIG